MKRKPIEEREFQFVNYVLFSVTHFLYGNKMVQNCSLFIKKNIFKNKIQNGNHSLPTLFVKSVLFSSRGKKNLLLKLSSKSVRVTSLEQLSVAEFSSG